MAKKEKKESSLVPVLLGLLLCLGICVCGCPALGVTYMYWAKPEAFPSLQAAEQVPSPERQQAMLEAHLGDAAHEMKDNSLARLRELNSPIKKAWYVRNFGPRGNDFYENVQTWDGSDNRDYLRLHEHLKSFGDRNLSVVTIDPGSYSQAEREVMRSATTKITLLQVRFKTGKDGVETMGPIVYANGGFRFLRVDGMLKKNR